MGLLDIFRKPKPVVAAPSTPIRPASGVHTSVNECYGPVFRAEMASIGLLSAAEIDSALALICGEDGCGNQGRYHRQVFDRFFSGKTWRWPWYEEWDARFRAFGGYPVRWPIFHGYKPPTSEVVVPRLTVVNLKALMASAGLEFPPTAKGAALRTIALQSSESRAALEGAPLWNSLAGTPDKSSEGFGEYTMVMRTILFRATCVSRLNRARALGLKGWRPVGISKEDQRFIDYALSLDPNSLTPLYPVDVTVMETDRPNFGDG